MLENVHVTREVCVGTGEMGIFCLGESIETLGALREKYAGRVKCVYMDPPFLSNGVYTLGVRIGARDWKRMSGSVKTETYSDTAKPEDYYAMMKSVCTLAYDMLSDDGAMFVHVDYRAHARLRLMLDDIFGEKNFVNEIIWAYNSGGRGIKSFARKHDVILFYRKTKSMYFNIEAVMEKRDVPPSNHMKKHVDPDGRVYRSIRSGGRTYTYYDDDPVQPTDVWDDISHLQQKDHERTGFDTQKPIRLLRRIERCCTVEGDIVLDPFAGSGTSLDAAFHDGRAFIGIDICPLTLNLVRRRLIDANVTYELGQCHKGECEAFIQGGVGFYHVTLDSFSPDEGAFGAEGFDAVDNWSIGYLNGETMEAHTRFARTHVAPELKTELTMPALSGTPVIQIGDVAGRNYYYTLKY